MSKTVFVPMRVTPQEKRKLQDLADACGLSKGEVLRRLLAAAGTKHVLQIVPTLNAVAEQERDGESTPAPPAAKDPA